MKGVTFKKKESFLVVCATPECGETLLRAGGCRFPYRCFNCKQAQKKGYHKKYAKIKKADRRGGSDGRVS